MLKDLNKQYVTILSGIDMAIFKKSLISLVSSFMELSNMMEYKSRKVFTFIYIHILFVSHYDYGNFALMLLEEFNLMV